MQQPLVSILIPFKNTAAFLDDCLNSIIDQTYTNWELLIVDDFSSDNSYGIVRSYVLKDQRIKVLRNKESGIINALQLAFKHSKGEYITRMDSDDIMPNEKIKVLVERLIAHGRQHIATGLVHYFSAEGISEGYKKYENWLNKLTEKGTNYSEIYKECVIPSPCWMVHRKDLIASGAFNSTRYPEDYDLTFRFCESGLKVIPCDQILHYWRDYGTRASRTDSNYAENSFLELKLHYFLKLHYNSNTKLVIWGAGKKGKTLAKQLIDQDFSFDWVCDNPKKIGKHIYDKLLKSFSYLETTAHYQAIITVANPKEQEIIKAFFKTHGKVPLKDYFFFC